MISIRESTFETNSSSCHSLTIGKKDTIEKILNKELLYVGNFEYADDYGVYENEINDKAVLSRDAVVNILKKFCSEVNVKEKFESDYAVSMQENCRKLEFNDATSLPEIVSMCKQKDVDLEDILEYYDLYYTSADIMFGNKDSSNDTITISKREFTDSEGNQIYMLHNRIFC